MAIRTILGSCSIFSTVEDSGIGGRSKRTVGPVVTVSQTVGACGRGSFGAGVHSVCGGGGHVGQVTSHVRGSGPLVSHKLARAGLWLSLLGLLAKIGGSLRA